LPLLKPLVSRCLPSSLSPFLPRSFSSFRSNYLPTPLSSLVSSRQEGDQPSGIVVGLEKETVGGRREDGTDLKQRGPADPEAWRREGRTARAEEGATNLDQGDDDDDGGGGGGGRGEAEKRGEINGDVHSTFLRADVVSFHVPHAGRDRLRGRDCPARSQPRSTKFSLVKWGHLF